MDRKDIYNLVIAKKLSGGGGGGDVPADLRNEMNTVFNEKFQTAKDYPPEDWPSTVEQMTPYPTDTASGSVANFSTSLTLPLVSHNVSIEPVQAGTGDPSPINDRPISGWSAVSGARTGKNLFDPNTEFSTVYNYGIAKNVLPSATCTMSFTNNDTTQDISGVYFGFVSSNYTGDAPSVYRWGIQNGVVVGDVNNLYLSEHMTALFYYPNNPATLEKVLNRFNVQIELGSTATTYEPYTGITVTIPLGQTVYGGTLDVTSGVLRVTHGNVDLGELTWTKQTMQNGIGFTARIEDGNPIGNVNSSDALCENYPEDTSVQNAYYINDKTFKYGGTYFGRRNIAILDSDLSNLSAAEFKTTMSGVKLCYPLETPVEITLTPEQINTLEGVNNIWADTGDTAVEYRCTVEDYINHHTQPEPNANISRLATDNTETD